MKFIYPVPPYTFSALCPLRLVLHNTDPEVNLHLVTEIAPKDL